MTHATTTRGREPLPSAFASTDTFVNGHAVIYMSIPPGTSTHLDKGIWGLAGEEIELVARCVEIVNNQADRCREDEEDERLAVVRKQ